MITTKVRKATKNNSVLLFHRKIDCVVTAKKLVYWGRLITVLWLKLKVVGNYSVDPLLSLIGCKQYRGSVVEEINEGSLTDTA